MDTLNDLIHEILKDIDDDIRAAVLKYDGKYYAWQHLTDPAGTILNWQIVRLRKKRGI